MNEMQRPQARIWVWVIVLTLMWGTNWVLLPLAIRELSIWTFRATALLGSGAIVLLAAHLKGVSLRIPRQDVRPLVLASLVYLVTWNVATTFAATLLPSGQAAVLGFTMPVWATILTWVVFKERPTTRLFASILLACIGVGLLVYSSSRGQGASVPGFLMGLSAGLGWAAGTIILKRGKLSVQPIVSTGWQLLIAGIPMAFVGLATGSHEAHLPSMGTLVVVAYITVVPMAIGNVLWFSIADSLPATVSGLSTVMVPIVAMITGALVRSEPLGPLEMAAMVCCMVAMSLALANRR